MSEMPERIWADHGDDVDVYGGWDLDGSAGTEYVRGDLVAELVKALESVKAVIDPACLVEGDIYGETKEDNAQWASALRSVNAALARAKGGTDD